MTTSCFLYSNLSFNGHHKLFSYKKRFNIHTNKHNMETVRPTDRGVHRVLVGKPEVKRPLGRPRSRWEDNIKMDLQEVGGGRGDWMELAQDRDGWRALVGKVRKFRVP